MFAPRTAFSGFSIDDLAKARTFYAETLGLQVENDAAVAAVQRREVRPVAGFHRWPLTDDVAAGRFDLDHVRAGVG